MSKKQKILQPQYLQNFKCDSAECEDICCRGWRVFIDKKSYDLYRKCPDAKLRQKLNKTIIRNRFNTNNQTYAKIKMNEYNSCPFLDDEKLCSLQRSMGEKYLSVTCASYPRYYNIINDILEKSAYLSCPLTAKLALLNTGLMEFDMTEEDISGLRFLNGGLDVADAQKKHTPEQYFTELRVFIISLLQNRLYPLWQRLVILGLFCKNLDSLISENKIDGILDLINTYLDHLKQDVFHDSLDNIPNHLSFQIELIKLIKIRADGTKDTRFEEFFGEAMQSINYSGELTKEELSAQYALVYEKYYLPVAAKHEYILENYLVNYVFMTLFPFKNEKCVFDNYVMLIVHYAMVKMLLIGIAGFHKEEFNTGHMISLIQSLTRVITHNPYYLKLVFNLLKSKNINNMTYMSILIKN